MERFDASSVEAVRKTVNSLCQEDTKSGLHEFIQWCNSRSDEEKKNLEFVFKELMATLNSEHGK